MLLLRFILSVTDLILNCIKSLIIKITSQQAQLKLQAVAVRTSALRASPNWIVKSLYMYFVRFCHLLPSNSIPQMFTDASGSPLSPQLATYTCIDAYLDDMVG